MTDKIDEIIQAILNGGKAETEKFAGKHFFVADTPQKLKNMKLSGDYFSVSYGVIKRHSGKDTDHNLSANDWREICRKIAMPFAIARHKNGGYRLFLDMKINGKFAAAGVDVKNVQKNLDINAIVTVFGRNAITNDDIFYISENTTHEQTALLEGHNSPSLPSAQWMV